MIRKTLNFSTLPITIPSAIALSILLIETAQASNITLESAKMGPSGISSTIGGAVINFSQFLGWRFEVDTELGFEVTSIGGNLLGSSTTLPQFREPIFGAIVKLVGPNALPLGAPFLQEEVIATTTFIAPVPNEDFRTPLNVTLEAGNYGLIFGGGLFGSPGPPNFNADAVMLPGNEPINGETFFFWDGSTTTEMLWRDAQEGLNDRRFVVQGKTEPQPSTPEPSAVLGTILLGLTLLVPKKKD